MGWVICDASSNSTVYTLPEWVYRLGWRVLWHFLFFFLSTHAYIRRFDVNLQLDMGWMDGVSGTYLSDLLDGHGVY